MKPFKNTLVSLIVVAGIGIATTIYQWLALIDLRNSGDKPLCAVSEKLDCSAVWDSAFSTTVHQYTSIPIAGWGLIWSVLILLLTLKLFIDSKNQKESSLVSSSLYIAAVIGLVGVAGLVIYSLSIAVFCLSCIVFYLVVIVIGITVIRNVKPPQLKLVEGSGLALGITVVLALLLYFPGQNTPLQSVFEQDLISDTSNQSNHQAGTKDSNESSASSEELKNFISSQADEVKQYMSNFLEEYRHAKLIEQTGDSSRLSAGTKDSPVKVVEWLEITCPHCAQLDQQLSNIKNSTSEYDWSLETRYYPLDSECNPDMQRSRNNGVSCLAAKSLICLSDDRETSHSIRSTFFANQKQLTTNMIRDIIRDHEVDMIELDACINADTTEDALLNDIDMARAHDISGTPLVVMNGKTLTAMPHLIYSLILSGGNTEAVEFSELPSPEEISHEGHDH